MNFFEALMRLKAGQGIRRKDWKPGIYFYLQGTIRCSVGNAYFFPEHFEADDWEVYVKPELTLKDKVKEIKNEIHELHGISTDAHRNIWKIIDKYLGEDK